jgi:hypothetical protein
VLYQPNFDDECLHCGKLPTVIVVGHLCPETELCGVCFFHDRLMVDWEEWNSEEESTE